MKIKIGDNVTWRGSWGTAPPMDAKITGIDGTVGSIDIGKDATLLICDGDLLDMKSSTISLAFIQGRMIDLDNIQHQLYIKYKKTCIYNCC
jgi:hypothetical protein